MLTVNEIVKEQMVQTTSKKVLRSSEKQKLRACNIHSTSGLKVLSGLRLTLHRNWEFHWLTVRLHLDKTFKKIKVIFIKCN